MLKCFRRFGSWTHTLAEVDVNLAFPGGIDLSTFKTVYKDVSEWDIYNHTGIESILNLFILNEFQDCCLFIIHISIAES